MKFIVVAPHSFCVTEERRCDTEALRAVHHIQEYNTTHDIHYHIADRIRKPKETHPDAEFDYNRDVTKYTEWRKELRNKARRINPDFVLEIHSFPSKHEYYHKRWKDADLVIFESAYNAGFVHRLGRDVAAKGVKVYIEPNPWNANSITHDMGPCWNHTLFEFNENRRSDQTRHTARVLLDCVEKIKKKRVAGDKIMMAIMVLIILFITWKFILYVQKKEAAPSDRASGATS